MRVKPIAIAIVVVLAFFVYLAWSTLRSQRAECRVTVEFNGRRNSATASAASIKEARRSAQTTACGTLARGMSESIACSGVPPVTDECRTL